MRYFVKRKSLKLDEKAIACYRISFVCTEKIGV